MESQEQFEEDLRRMAFENEERRRKMFEDNPENIPIPIATGGTTKLAKGKQVKKALNCEMLKKMLKLRMKEQQQVI